MSTIYSYGETVYRLGSLLDTFPVAPTEDRPLLIEEIDAIFQRIKGNLTHQQVLFLAEKAFYSIDAIEEDERQWRVINEIIDLSEIP